ncbi:hypothetical protein [Dokdonella sp.]|uniref:hypothetical protein n=1 Tax=Dokdonella sp. TaxID=2291710 RepID=UPI001B1A2460|nr:hypothetical protein [Dokdonella sp.]MBO9664338.1 hypothetical protein [Dokdonella sp.]
MHRRSNPRARIAPAAGIAAALTFATAFADAAVFTVGTPSGPGQPCTHGTIQSAINAANNSPGADTIRLTRSLTYEPEANTIDTAQDVTIEGGYADCSASADNTNTIVSGAGGAQAPVFTINAGTGAWIHLRRLTISGGDEDGTGKGGGIYFKGDGLLEVRDSLITQNTAGSGGGIYAEGTGTNAELAVGNDVVISNNTARYNGGGIVADGIEMSMLEPNSILLGNQALGTGGSGGYGGGLYVYSGGLSSYASIGSGSPFFGAVYNNRARYGGGVAVGGSAAGGNRAELNVYATADGVPARIVANSASVAGGGIHVRSEDSALDGDLFAKAHLFNAALEENTSPQGAAVQVQGSDTIVLVESFAMFTFNIGEWPAGAVRCTVGVACGRIAGNLAVDAANQPTQGAVLNAEHDAVLWLGSLGSGLVFEGNRGGRLIDSVDSDDYNPVEIRNALITGNQVGHELVRSSGGDGLSVFDSTVAGNTVGAGNLLAATGKDVQLRRSILWQPGLTTLARSGGSLAVESMLASEVGSFTGAVGSGVLPMMVDPRFVDPQHGDYRLRAASPAVDLAAAIAGDDRDVLGFPHDQDLPAKGNFAGVRDIGAFERQSLQPLVLNGDFDFSDLRLWTWFAGQWDGTLNATGAANSGSWKFSDPEALTTQREVGQQCVHLPGPGRYLLNGWGQGGGNSMQTRDNAVLVWEFRRLGGEDCTAGAPDRSGEMFLGSGTSWQHPAQPTAIDVPPADFYSSSSITVRLVARQGGVTGAGPLSAWFDGITLDFDGDRIFADDFD